MEVIALKEGFFGGSRKRVGEKFDVPKGTKGSWFTPAQVETEKPKGKQPPAGGQPPANGQGTNPPGGQTGGDSDDLV